MVRTKEPLDERQWAHLETMAEEKLYKLNTRPSSNSRTT